jgi:hypothetical protein
MPFASAFKIGAGVNAVLREEVLGWEISGIKMIRGD